MVDRQRRRPTLSAALALLLALGCDGAAEVRAELETEPAEGARPAESAEAEPERPAPAAGAFEERIGGLVHAWIEEARRRTDGKAHAGNVTVAVEVVDLASGTELASIQAEQALTPASNMKLVTSAAALERSARKPSSLTGRKCRLPRDASAPSP